ncbi:MAG: MarR family transcriptional regulator [Spirochaetales bacterium]|nr:MarR family transcriptional regulator [Spirochaetales bacterium]
MSKELGKEFYHLIYRLNSDLMIFELEHMKEESIEQLTLHEIHTIENIGHLEDRTMSELARKAGVKQSTMTVMINKLIMKNFVERYGDSLDRRVIKVRLTEKGERAHQMHDILHQKVTNQWLENLEVEECDCLMKVLRKMMK